MLFSSMVTVSLSSPLVSASLAAARTVLGLILALSMWLSMELILASTPTMTDSLAYISARMVYSYLILQALA